MFARFAGVAAAKQSKTRWDPSQERMNILTTAEELKILQKYADFYTFKRFPWTFWILATVLLSICFFLHYFLWWVLDKDEYIKNNLTTLQTFIFFSIDFDFTILHFVFYFICGEARAGEN
jgi:hypothetical protein